MLFENSIVGPIHSRRLGTSLGVNLLPIKHKYCSYDCIYCECGWNKESENQIMQYSSPDELRQQLEQRLIQLRHDNVQVDSFTFAGNGEPTLYPHFPQAVDMVISMRNQYYPSAATTLLTNATQLKKPEIFAAVERLDNPVLKLDAGTPAMRQLINRNNDMGCTWDELIAQLKAFGSKGIIQTLLFDGYCDGKRVSNIIESEFNPYIAYLKEIAPRYVMLYALDRATPEKNLRKLPVEELEHYAELIRKEGIEAKVYG